METEKEAGATKPEMVVTADMEAAVAADSEEVVAEEIGEEVVVEALSVLRKPRPCLLSHAHQRTFIMPHFEHVP